MDDIAVMKWLHEEAGKAGFTGPERQKVELLMATAYRKGWDERFDDMDPDSRRDD